MSVYSQYGSSIFDEEITANESYAGLSGAFKMITDSIQNEHAIFEAVIEQDFAEAYNKINSAIVSESQLEVIQESGIKTVWSKVVEFIKTVGEKILGIIKTLKDRIQAVFIRDGKQLVDKYKKQVYEAYNTGKLAKMTFKYVEPAYRKDKKTLDDRLATSNLFVALNQLTKEKMTKVNPNRYDSKENPAYDPSGKQTDLKPFTDEEKKDIFDDALNRIIGSNSDAKSFAKDFEEKFFGEVEEKEGLSKDLLDEIVKTLQTGKESLDQLDKEHKATSNKIKTLERDAKKVEKETLELLRSADAKLNTYKANVIASKVMALTSIWSNVSGRYYGALGAVIKKDLKQCRAIFVKAATYNHKKPANEQVELLEAVEQVSNYEVDEMFADAEMI